MVKQIDVLTAKQMLESTDVTFVDVRDEVSYRIGHPEGAISLTNANLNEFILDTNKSHPVLVICYHGISSLNVGEYLSQNGFEDVYSISGGYEEWRRDE